MTTALAVLPAAAGAQEQAPAQQHSPGGQAPSPSSVEALLDAARAAARADRNRESADFFARVIEHAPGRRRELLREYADQLTYSSRARQALPLYREVLAGSPAPEERRQTLRALGLALLWSDRPGEARAVYEELLRGQASDPDARRNLARALSWSGRQRQAAAVLQDLLREHPDDQEARVQLAQAQAWMGRPDRAQATLSGSDSQRRDDARRLQRELERQTAPRTRAEVQHSSQSDRLDIEALRLDHETSIGRGRGMWALRLDRLQFEREDDSDSARLERPMLRGRYRFGDAAELNAEFGRERIEPRDGVPLDRLVYSSWFTWWPSDIVRLDLSSSRSTFDNLRSLRLGLTARQQGLSMDLTPDERQRYTARAERSFYSDGNRRWSGQLEGEYRWRTRPETWIGLRHSRLEFARLLDNGYFNPESFRATQLTLRLAQRLGGDAGRWDWGAFLAFGREHAEPGGSKPNHDLSLRAGWQLSAHTRLEARVQRFTSRTSALSGFERTTFRVGLERNW